MRIIMIRGFSGTGKTTIIESLTAELCRRGYRVGTVKNIHHPDHQVDVPGKDTFRHRAAGASRVTARGPFQTAIMVSEAMEIEDILQQYDEDFVLLEGNCGVSCPVILTGRTTEDVDQRMCPEAVAISGMVAELLQQGTSAGEHQVAVYRGLPVIHGIDQAEKLADLVEEKAKSFDLPKAKA